MEQCASVHPHACGADCDSASASSQVCAVHPHACGADTCRGFVGADNRTVHPHACGADATDGTITTAEEEGSSPRVWGRCVIVIQYIIVKRRFIPTRVGQIGITLGGASGGYPVHPHACGADPCTGCDHRRVAAVHPHACGADAVSKNRPRNTLSVHPHACGADGI